MSLNIENSTIGFDSNNVQVALNNLNTRCIQDSVTKMTNSMSELTRAVNDAWVGKSAEQFKTNMETDKNTITSALNDTYEALRSEMYQIVDTMAEADNALVQPRSE